MTQVFAERATAYRRRQAASHQYEMALRRRGVTSRGTPSGATYDPGGARFCPTPGNLLTRSATRLPVSRHHQPGLRLHRRLRLHRQRRAFRRLRGLACVGRDWSRQEWG